MAVILNEVVAGITAGVTPTRCGKPTAGFDENLTCHLHVQIIFRYDGVIGMTETWIARYTDIAQLGLTIHMCVVAPVYP